MKVQTTILVCITLATCYSPVAAKESNPNILILLPDDLGWNDIGYHNEKVITPNLDRLAKGGVRFEQHYVCTTCSPTRAALLTGRFPSRFNIRGPIAGKSKQALPTDIVTLPSMLKKKGYETAIIGKWHLGLRPEVGPRKYGFDYTYGYLHGQIDPITHLYKFGDKTWHRNDKLFEEEGHATDLITEDAVRFIQKKRKKPFFLYVPYSVPHTPLIEDDRWQKPYQNVKEDSRRLFLASVTHMDHGIGRIVEALEKTGQRENTIILFSSDNGGQKSGGKSKTQYGGKFPAYPVLADNTPLRGWKGQLFEGGIRVPAFINWKGTLKPNSFEGPMHIVDWLPTFAAKLNIEIPKSAKLDGQNVWPSSNLSFASSNRQLYGWTGKSMALRVGDWKLIQIGNKFELYNLAKDPTEKKNLAKLETQRLTKLQQILKAERVKDQQ